MKKYHSLMFSNNIFKKKNLRLIQYFLLLKTNSMFIPKLAIFLNIYELIN